MSKLTFAANGSIIKNNKIIESMADTKPLNYFNLSGNLKLAGSIRATNFIKDDGSILETVTVDKLALPENVYYLNKRIGVNEENPQADLDVKGTTRLQGGLTGSDALFAGSFIAQGPSNFKGQVTAEDELVVGKNAGIRGNLGVAGNFGTQGTATFKGLVTAEDEVVIGKHARIGGNLGVAGNFGTQGTATFKGPVIASEDITATRHLNASGNANVTGDITFNGANKWILHTPDDNRKIMYVAPGNDKGEWMWDKQTMFNNDGSVQLSGALMLGGQNVAHPDVGDGAFYRADGQVQIATDDLIRLRHVGSKATGIQFDVREGAGDVNTPNGQMKITRQGIMFGGPNADREINSGQISAGLHIPNSLNIVGMSADKNAASRRIDMWAEGGLNVYGPTVFKGGVSNQNPANWGTHLPWAGDQKNYIRGDTEMRGNVNNMGVLRAATNVPVTDATGEQLVIGNTNESNLRLGRHTDYSWIQSHGSKPLRINPLGNDVCIHDTCFNKNSSGMVFMVGYRNDGTVSRVSKDINGISDDMNILTFLPAINTEAQSKAAVYFNIRLANPADSSKKGDFTVTSDDGILFEYSNSTSQYLDTPSDWNGIPGNGIPGSLSANVIGDYKGWKGQGATQYSYSIPNASSTGIVKCKLAWYQGGGGVAFQIKGLKSAINALGSLA